MQKINKTKHEEITESFGPSEYLGDKINAYSQWLF